MAVLDPLHRAKRGGEGGEWNPFPEKGGKNVTASKGQAQKEQKGGG